MPAGILERARRAARLTQQELALRAGTSRPTVSAYEHGRKVPTLDTAVRLLQAADHDLELVPRITFTDHPYRGRVLALPSSLPRLPLEAAFARVELPLHLSWSGHSRSFELADRSDRARVYEIVLREGTAQDVLTYIDGALLVDLWPDLVLPRAVRAVWDPIVTVR